MARIMVIYDPNNRIRGLSPDTLKRLGVKEAVLSLAEDDPTLEEIQTAAGKLIALLVEQL
jgi:hypothetical protein